MSEAGRLESDGLGLALVYPGLLEAYTLVMRRLGVAAAHRWMAEAVQGCVT